ncbi:MAG: response regulator [Desulfobacterales bacterium]|nr:response regulator [Desulfobacterales bacterium]MCP4160691.1 response regulator [Deltaproteobacteria bacterium]
MPVLTISNGLYSNAQKIISQLETEAGYNLITDKEIMERTAENYNLKLSTIQKVLQNKKIAFNDFTHEKEKCLACLRQTISESLKSEKCLLHGVLGHLIPKSFSHIIRILIITDKENRIKTGMDLHGNAREETLKAINNFDKHSVLLTKEITGKGAFDEKLYDIVIPTDKLDVNESVDLINKHSEKFKVDNFIKKEMVNFQLSSKVALALSKAGSKLEVESDEGNVIVTIDKSVIMLSKFKQKITSLAKEVPDVKSVETKLGKNYYSTTVVRRLDVEKPLRLLLVDDEKEFVQTLSERLKLREFPSEIAYDGQQALEMTEKEDTEVMLLDLKMPGVDGFEVLKKIKETKPYIEVIILTGHGSEEDKKTCMELGAFAYLQKPADIDLLTSTMKEAYEKINAKN